MFSIFPQPIFIIQLIFIQLTTTINQPTFIQHAALERPRYPPQGHQYVPLSFYLSLYIYTTRLLRTTYHILFNYLVHHI